MVIYFAVTIKVAHIILIICTFVCYFSATALNLAFPFVDPGIIPKPSLENEGEEIPINRAEIVSSRSQGVFPNREYTFPMKTHELSVKYCGNCSIYRPPRTIHCYSCGGCIEKLDHHCPWLGTCIGKRNYSLYIFYIVFMQILTALLCVQTVIYTIASPFAENEIGFILNFLICNFLLI
jgi:palmitoyltransferase ZDHHC9/14/18